MTTDVPPKGCDFVITEAVRVKGWQTKSGEPVEGRIQSFEERCGVAGALVDRGLEAGARWYPLKNLETNVDEHECDCECGAHG